MNGGGSLSVNVLALSYVSVAATASSRGPYNNVRLMRRHSYPGLKLNLSLQQNNRFR